MMIENIEYQAGHFHNEDFYIFAIGYEHRSYHLHDLIISELGHIKSSFFVFDDYMKYDHVFHRVQKLEENNERINIVNYIDSQNVQMKILGMIREMIARNNPIKVHIDYSSMPRSWYCGLPILLQGVLRKDDKVYFWYSEGEYPDSYEEYPSAGIDAFSFFSGKPSLQIDNERVHVLALGYDVIRTQAIISIIDPNYLVVCYAYNPDRSNFLENIKKVNHPILSRSALSLALPLNDFSFMVSKLRETANELLPTADVIFIPDGPKPLIFAMSLVPKFLDKQGITCLHVARNSTHFKAIDVKPTGITYGFLVQADC